MFDINLDVKLPFIIMFDEYENSHIIFQKLEQVANFVEEKTTKSRCRLKTADVEVEF